MSFTDVRRRLLTIDEVAERLGQSRGRSSGKIRRSELPALQLGGTRSAIPIDERELTDSLYRPTRNARRVFRRGSRDPAQSTFPSPKRGET
jgi:hypothetical protein